MCLPGTVEVVRERIETEGLPRIDRRTALLGAAGVAVAAAFPGAAQARTIPTKRMQDLTHVFRDDFPMFPGAPSPTRETFVSIPENGYYGQVWTLWEHTATHMDAPGHFVPNGRLSPQITPSELILPIVVVDISRKAAANPDAVVTVADVRSWERGNGRIPRGALVAMNSGWDARAGSESAYQNGMHFPGWSSEAVEWLLAHRAAAAFGVDTLSLDPGNSTTFAAHYAILGANRYGLENLANLSKIPARGATAFVGLVPWEEGSGGPSRVLAVW